MMHQAEDRAGMDAVLRDIAASQSGFLQAVVDHVLAVRAVLRRDGGHALEPTSELGGAASLCPPAPCAPRA
jgi:hypothetical protein